MHKTPFLRRNNIILLVVCDLLKGVFYAKHKHMQKYEIKFQTINNLCLYEWYRKVLQIGLTASVVFPIAAEATLA